MRTTLSTLILLILHGETRHRFNSFSGTPHISRGSYSQGSMATAFILRLASATAAFGGVRQRSAMPRIARDREIVSLSLPDWRRGEDSWLRSASCAQCPMTMKTPPALYVVRGGRTPPSPSSSARCRRPGVGMRPCAWNSWQAPSCASSHEHRARALRRGSTSLATSWCDGDRTLTRRSRQWHTEALLDDGLLATIGTCAGALRGQFMYLLDEDQADDSPLERRGYPDARTAQPPGSGVGVLDSAARRATDDRRLVGHVFSSALPLAQCLHRLDSS